MTCEHAHAAISLRAACNVLCRRLMYSMWATSPSLVPRFLRVGTVYDDCLYTALVAFTAPRPVCFEGGLSAGEISSAGNAGQSVLLISVPRFADSGILVLLNVRTLAVQPLQFDSQLN